jgi:hypothetical protein
VSEYLSRLATRARVSNERQLLRPFVRSTSPIAAHDQRIGMAAAEGFKTVGASPDQSRSGSAAGSLGEFQTAGRPDMEPANRMGETIVQRKMAVPSVGQAGPSPRNAPAGPAAACDASPSLAAMEVKSAVAEPATGSGADVRVAINKPGFSEPLAPQETARTRPKSFPEPSETGDEPPVFAAESAWTDSPHSGSWGKQAASREAGRVIVHTRSVRQKSPIDSAGLEPVQPAFVDRVKPSPEGYDGFSAGANKKPRIVIGRIDVEVVPPPASERVATSPRPRPLTAASASVIGPLGGVRPNLRLSLRYR